MACFARDSPDTGMSFGASQKWALKVIQEVELQTPWLFTVSTHLFSSAVVGELAKRSSAPVM